MLARDSSPISSKMSALINSNSPASSLSKIASNAPSGSPKTKANANQFQSKKNLNLSLIHYVSFM